MLLFSAFSHRISETPKGTFLLYTSLSLSNLNVSKRVIKADAASAVVPSIPVSFSGHVEGTTSHFLRIQVMITDIAEKAVSVWQALSPFAINFIPRHCRHHVFNLVLDKKNFTNQSRRHMQKGRPFPHYSICPALIPCAFPAVLSAQGSFIFG